MISNEQVSELGSLIIIDCIKYFYKPSDIAHKQGFTHTGIHRRRNADTKIEHNHRTKGQRLNSPTEVAIVTRAAQSAFAILIVHWERSVCFCVSPVFRPYPPVRPYLVPRVPSTVLFSLHWTLFILSTTLRSLFTPKIFIAKVKSVLQSVVVCKVCGCHDCGDKLAELCDGEDGWCCDVVAAHRFVCVSGWRFSS